ncbi:hypothetical protein F4818DRAFT_454679 [Hypoxylon cercidicola]|nr:hypothetical protein F4818DRAFT_454679 [Hypoxylon cercidicola]
MAKSSILVRIMFISIILILFATRVLSSPMDTMAYNCSSHHNITAISNVSNGNSGGSNAVGFVGQEKNATLLNSTIMKGGEGGNSSCELCWTGSATSTIAKLPREAVFSFLVCTTLAFILTTM